MSTKGFASILDEEPEELIPTAPARRRSKAKPKATQTLPISHLIYLKMARSKTPRKILDYIRSMAILMNGQWVCFMDSGELSEATGKPASYNSKMVLKLKSEGWFEVAESCSSGSRTLIISDPESLGLPIQ